MHDPTDAAILLASRCEPWNKGKLIGATAASPTEARLVDPHDERNERAALLLRGAAQP
jgi:hypothetical protein